MRWEGNFHSMERRSLKRLQVVRSSTTSSLSQHCTVGTHWLSGRAPSHLIEKFCLSWCILKLLSIQGVWVKMLLIVHNFTWVSWMSQSGVTVVTLEAPGFAENKLLRSSMKETRSEIRTKIRSTLLMVLERVLSLYIICCWGKSLTVFYYLCPFIPSTMF